jgi:hypothetical protein
VLVLQKKAEIEKSTQAVKSTSHIIPRTKSRFGTEQLALRGLMTCTMVAMVTMGGDLQPGCLADRLLTGLGQPQTNP